MKINWKAFGLSFMVGLLGAAVVWAVTIDQIWQAVYDSTNTALRINKVAGN